MPEIKEFNLKDTWRVVLIIFSGIYVGIGFALFEIYSSDFYAFNPPFSSPLLNSIFLPFLVLVMPSIVLSCIYLFLYFINSKSAIYFLLFTVSLCLLLYFMRVNYILNPGYAVSNMMLVLLSILFLIIVLALNRFVLTLFQFMILVSLPLTLYFSIQYYGFLNMNRVDRDSSPSYLKKIGNTKNPVFVIIFDELSSYLLLDENGRINADLFLELVGFAGGATWYPNATSQVSETITSVSNLFSGYNYFNDCKPVMENCGNDIITALSQGKTYTKDIRNLAGIDSVTNKIDSWNVSIKMDSSYTSDNKNPHSDKFEGITSERYGSSYRSIREYIRNVAEVYMQNVINPGWSFKILGVSANFDLNDSEFADGAIIKGLPDSYGFMVCAINEEMEIRRFNTFINRIGNNNYIINSMHSSLTHTPFCYDTDGLVEVVYPIRVIKDKYGDDHYLPDAVASRDYTQSSCTKDEIAYNLRRSRINQTMLAMRLFGETINKLKQSGIYDESLIVAISDHGTGFLGPSFGRGNHMLRSKQDILDNKMMNASIPLFIKYPGQKQPSINKQMVRPIDVAATIFDVLDFKPPWRLDGQSLLSEYRGSLTPPPVNFYQMLYRDNSWRSWIDGGIYVSGEITEPTLYFPQFEKRADQIRVADSNWIGRDVNEMKLKTEKSGKLEYLKIEKALPGENKGDYVLTLGGYSYDPELNPPLQTFIAINGKIIKSIKPCLGFTRPEHKMGDILGGWLVTIPREFIKSRKLHIRAFSPVENSDEELFYELEYPISIELTEEQFRKVGTAG